MSLPKTIKTYPAIGWIRGNEATDNTELLKQLNDLRQENNKLEKQVEELQKNKGEMLDLAQGEDEFLITVQCYVMDGEQSGNKSWKQEVTWNELFKCIGPKTLKKQSENIIFDTLGKFVASRKYKVFHSSEIDYSDFEKITVQFLSLGYINFTGIGATSYWEITPQGKSYLLQIMSIKREIYEVDNE